MTVPLVGAVHDWYCPNCHLTDQTVEARPHTRFHNCPRMGMLTVPMLPAGVKAKVERVMRQDYVGREQIRTDDAGRPVQSVITTRDDGTDCVVYAPTAQARSG